MTETSTATAQAWETVMGLPAQPLKDLFAADSGRVDTMTRRLE